MQEKAHKPIIEVTLDRELDLVVAYRNAMKLAEISGLNFTDQTKFATAVSEICRNALQHVGKGLATFDIRQEGAAYFIEAVISDAGPGIKDLEALLEKLDSLQDGQRTGIVNCKRLSDTFEIESTEGSGTCVRIGIRLPLNHPPINRLILSGWRKHFSQLTAASPYDELKRQNHLLLKTLEELKQSKTQVQEHLEEIQSLNAELEQNNGKLMQLSKDYAQQNILLKKRNEELDEFAHIVSHDLKGPLRNLQGLVQLLDAGRSKDPQELMALLKGQLKKMESLIESILTYSRSGHKVLDKTEVNLNKLLTELIEGLSRPAGFTIDIQPHFPVIHTEEIFLFQIFSNLLHNAIKYNNKAEGRIMVGYERNEQGDFIYFVEDNGIGIPDENREKAFDIFTVLHQLKGLDSTGIGLAIVKKIIQEKGGQIWIEDTHLWTEGCRFCFTWPAALVQ